MIEAYSVDDAYHKAMSFMDTFGEEQPSRNGNVFSPPFPVTTVYHDPTKRVIFNMHRAANPFFHLAESVWMLAGENDARWLDQFVSDFSARYAEKDGTQYGAYGHRWRKHFAVDQLEIAAERLRRDPQDRRVVIQMWDAMVDMFDPRHEPVEPRDVPCNTQIYPRIVSGLLDITVTCRSNDVVWGAYGANAVHFSIMQEYLAGLIGVGVGTYYQISNNWHLYSSVADKFRHDLDLPDYPGTAPIGENWDAWLGDAKMFVSDPFAVGHPYVNRWFENTLGRMMRAYHLHKRDKNPLGARQVADTIEAPDWRLAAVRWLEAR